MVFCRSVNKGRAASAGVIATGGGQRGFNSNMALLRKSPGSNNFDQPLQTGSVVLLGEEIVLRANVQDGDGKLKTLFLFCFNQYF